MRRQKLPMSAQESEAMLVVTGGRVVVPGAVLSPGTVVVGGGKILAVEEGVYREGDVLPSGLRVMGSVIHAEGLTVAPGLIDIHVHGAIGYDTMDATPEAIAGMARFFAQHGVTSFLPTTVTAGRSETLAAIENVGRCLGPQAGGAEVLGIHLEGPYVNVEKKGAQSPVHIRPADPEEYKAFFKAGPVRLITLAPEIEANRDLIPFAVEHGAAVAVGHSTATYDEVLEAVSLGLNQATHTFNGMNGLHHRRPGTAGAVLSCDEIYAQVIVDFIHLHPAVVKILVYELGGLEVTVKDGAARLASGSLAGSTLTLDRAVRNVMEATGLSLVEVLTMATITAAHSIGEAERKGSLEPGKDADIILLDEAHKVKMTIVGGTVVYRAD